MYSDWLKKEYDQWVDILELSTVDNFARRPMVQRMLSINAPKHPYNKLNPLEESRINLIASLGGLSFIDLRFDVQRMIYYAQRVLKENPTHIVEIGGGVGQFAAILSALGYEGKYYIYDIPQVNKFQRVYLDSIYDELGVFVQMEKGDFDYCVSFYALGEFEDSVKYWYIENIVKKCPHGLIAWNPHSGASDIITFPCRVEPEPVQSHPNNKLLVW